MAEDTDVILNIRAKTEDAEAKIRRLETQLKSSAGSALTEAQGRVKKLEEQIKKAALASQSAFGAVGLAIGKMTTAIQSVMGPLGQLQMAVRLAEQGYELLQGAVERAFTALSGGLTHAQLETKYLIEATRNLAEAEDERVSAWRRHNGEMEILDAANAKRAELETRYSKEMVALMERWDAYKQSRTPLGGSYMDAPWMVPQEFAGLARGEALAAARDRKAKEDAEAQYLRGGASAPGSAPGAEYTQSFAVATAERLVDSDAMQLSRMLAAQMATSAVGQLGRVSDLALAAGPTTAAMGRVGLDRQQALRGFGEMFDASKMQAAADLMAELADSTTMAGSAFHSFSSAVAVGIGAAIDGSESIGAAMKKAAAISLKATATQSAVKALEEGAYALGSLAFGDARGAALHGKASAMFAATAIAAGAGAAALGGGAASTAGGGGAGASGGGGGGGYISAARPEAPAPITININGSIGSDDGPKILRQIEEAVRTGRVRQGGAASF